MSSSRSPRLCGGLRVPPPQHAHLACLRGRQSDRGTRRQARAAVRDFLRHRAVGGAHSGGSARNWVQGRRADDPRCGALLIVGYLALGALLQLLVRDLATGLGLTGLVVSPAFGYAGVGFPTLGMNAFSQIWGAILPVRWYMAVLLGRRRAGCRFRIRAPLCGAGDARRALLAARVPPPERGRAEHEPQRTRSRADGRPAAPRGIGGAFAAEWRRVLSIRGAFILLVVAPLVYGVYYPQPYLNQILRKIPIAVVDNDLSELSRASSDAGRERRRQSGGPRRHLAGAHAALDRGEVFAVVGIPPQTERDVLKGTTVHIPIYADATYLFIFRTMGNGIAVAINTLSSELAAGGARTDGSLVKATLASTSPADILLQPIFNPVGGYASYIVPAAFVLILQQMLLIGHRC